MTKNISVIVADDHKMVREMWSDIFADNHHIDVIGESGSIEEALYIIKKKQPDIVLLDINMPPASGMDAVPSIIKISPKTKIIAVSMHTQPFYAQKMISLGAKAYVTKNSSATEILQAIDEVMNDKIYICSELKDSINNSEPLDKPAAEVKSLSSREKEITSLIKRGLSSKEIASKLQLSERTIEVHRYNILKKLNLKNTASLISYLNSHSHT